MSALSFHLWCLASDWDSRHPDSKGIYNLIRRRISDLRRVKGVVANYKWPND